MKKRLLWMVVLALAMSLLCVSCASTKLNGAGDGGHYYAPAGYSSETYPDYASSEKGKVSSMGTEDSLREETPDGKPDMDIDVTNNRQQRSGLITASAWDDNNNYDSWKALFNQQSENEEAGKFADYIGNSWKFDTLNRVKVTVKNGENFVCGATVSTIGADQKEYKAVTNANGVAYIFPKDEEGTITVTSGEGAGSAAFTAESRDLTVELTSNAGKVNLIKLMFVVDVTGSMGDELNYLANEITDVIGRIARNDDQTHIDLAFLFYRDNGDNDKLDYVEFKNVTDPAGLAEQQRILSTKYATGGGDIPEALDEALLMAVNKNWGEENSTKIIFHVFDAPSHSNKDNRTRCGQAAEIAAEKGIRYCPVLCSGADLLCEYIARQGAVYTGGTFIFVTDHSGIGNPHYDPNVPNAVVEKLNDLMVRLVIGYHTGTFAAPVWWNAK